MDTDIIINITDKEFFLLSDFVRRNYGIHLKPEKKALMVGRLHNILVQKGFKCFNDYYEYVISDITGEAIISLINKISTNYSFFLREQDHFQYFISNVIPWLSDSIKDHDLRIWSAGCSTGEEPYTLAMYIDEYFGANKALWNTKILATDISTDVLQKASSGVYNNDQITSIPERWKKLYFKKNMEGNNLIVDKIRNEVIFRRFNLMDRVFPFKKRFHIIFCRNVMIYFDLKTKKDLVEKFYDITEPGGYLFIGHSESLNREETKYRYIKPAIYRK